MVVSMSFEIPVLGAAELVAACAASWFNFFEEPLDRRDMDRLSSFDMVMGVEYEIYRQQRWRGLKKDICERTGRQIAINE